MSPTAFVVLLVLLAVVLIVGLSAYLAWVVREDAADEEEGRD